MTRGKSGSSSQSEDRIGRELMTPDEVGRMDNKECIVMIRGEYPIKGKNWMLQNIKEPSSQVCLENHIFIGNPNRSNGKMFQKFWQKHNSKRRTWM